MPSSTVRIFSFFAAFRLLYKNSPDNYSVLSGNGNKFSEDWGEFQTQNNAQRHSTRIEPNDYFRPVLVFAPETNYEIVFIFRYCFYKFSVQVFVL